jgi:transcription elongation factor Elf1
MNNFDISENIVLPEIPTLKKKFECPCCGKQYKTKKSFEKHVEQCQAEAEAEYDMENLDMYDENMDQPEDIIDMSHPSEHSRELLRLRNELEQLVLSNPMLNLSSPISTTPLESIQKMSIEELKARIFQAKRELNGKLDSKISDSALTMVNMVVGKMLNCVDELQEEVMNDPLLRESTKDLLSFSVLSKIPPQLKVSGLYAVNVGVAMQKKKQKNSVSSIENKQNV